MDFYLQFLEFAGKNSTHINRQEGFAMNQSIIERAMLKQYCQKNQDQFRNSTPSESTEKMLYAQMQKEVSAARGIKPIDNRAANNRVLLMFKWGRSYAS